MRFFTSMIVAALAGLGSAFTPPDYSKPPAGNPIAAPGLNQQVPVGKPFTITWQPTSPGPISIILLRGPSTNVTPILTIVDGIANTGTYQWTPSSTLTDDVTHYGLLLVDDSTRQYQYSTQFGIDNPGYKPPSGSVSSMSSLPWQTVTTSSASTVPTVRSSTLSTTVTTTTRSQSYSVASSTSINQSSTLLSTSTTSTTASITASTTASITTSTTTSSPVATSPTAATSITATQPTTTGAASRDYRTSFGSAAAVAAGLIAFLLVF